MIHIFCSIKNNAITKQTYRRQIPEFIKGALHHCALGVPLPAPQRNQNVWAGDPESSRFEIEQKIAAGVGGEDLEGLDEWSN